MLRLLKWLWKVLLKGEEVKIEAMHQLYGKKKGEDNGDRKTDL